MAEQRTTGLWTSGKHSATDKFPIILIFKIIVGGIRGDCKELGARKSYHLPLSYCYETFSQGAR